jgi:PAS domain S-box-containing protein
MAQERRSARQLRSDLKRAEENAQDHERQELLHELRVYQEELTSQNEELIRAQAALEETRDRFIELYDFAPNGYLTLDEHGVVRQINLTGAALLGRTREAIEGRPLMGFVNVMDRPRVLDFMRLCRTQQSQAATTVDVTIRGGDEPRFVQLLHRQMRRSGNSREFFTTMIDMTEQKRMADAREQVAQERIALARRLISIQEDERHRIARDIHDNLGQQLTGLRLKLDAIALSSDLGDELRSQLSEVLAAAHGLDRSLDFIASELRPTALDLGLPAALDQFVREWSATFNISAELHVSDMTDLRIAPDVETHLYRITQEALNNVYKHANAKHVNVILECHPGALLLVVEDNGKGFQPHKSGARRGMGLMSMRERASIIGAALDIESTPGAGTAVFLRVPNDVLRRVGDVI